MIIITIYIIILLIYYSLSPVKPTAMTPERFNKQTRRIPAMQMTETAKQHHQTNDNTSRIDHYLRSEDLFQHGRTIDIGHNGQTYTLRLTAANKLILTK